MVGMSVSRQNVHVKILPHKMEGVEDRTLWEVMGIEYSWMGLVSWLKKNVTEIYLVSSLRPQLESTAYKNKMVSY